LEVRYRSGQGVTGQVALSGKIQITNDLHNAAPGLVLEAEKERLGSVVAGIALPLHSQKGMIGVLHVWMEEKHTFDEADIRLLTALVDMAGNAIQRGILHEQALSHAQELSLAYDKTLAGWARALELRDEQTEDHARRVTELTLRLAPTLGASAGELVQIGRGALLHDIGKMGIPDDILLKPGALTAEEKKIMERHTQYAHDMLTLIPFLHPAIDIPYCHHERWDGNGYPRGLKGQEIPLAARIFAVVDVWDALTSDRPYRKAWSKAETAEYLSENAGKHFEPRIVEQFLEQLSSQAK
jgi:HD-GYP domain-containing protein (c-di-GMP phosphodiesterase class II)